MKKAIRFLAAITGLYFLSLASCPAQDIIIKKSGDLVFCFILRVDSNRINISLKINDRDVQTSIVRDDVRFYRKNYKAGYLTDSIVYLKDGKSLKGIILEHVPGQHVMLLEGDKILHELNYQEIDRFEKQEIDPDAYGGVFSFGVALGGGGIVGIPMRLNAGTSFAFETGIYFRPVMLATSMKRYFYSGFMIAGGPTFYFSNVYKPLKKKVVRDGISVKGGIGRTFSSPAIPMHIVSVNWNRESFKIDNPRGSFIMELGAGMAHTGPYSITESYSDANSYGTVTTSGNSFTPMLYWKFHWCAHTK